MELAFDDDDGACSASASGSCTADSRGDIGSLLNAQRNLESEKATERKVSACGKPW